MIEKLKTAVNSKLHPDARYVPCYNFLVLCDGKPFICYEITAVEEKVDTVTIVEGGSPTAHVVRGPVRGAGGYFTLRTALTESLGATIASATAGMVYKLVTIMTFRASIPSSMIVLNGCTVLKIEVDGFHAMRSSFPTVSVELAYDSMSPVSVSALDKFR
ncbi:MAG: hypothetical protein LBJ38_02005 [Oscillospiraceae bacterium]|jgi:hypothetical protein|nr:hypothetical protein [Oscillospiraceae bacterium]